MGQARGLQLTQHWLHDLRTKARVDLLKISTHRLIALMESDSSTHTNTRSGQRAPAGKEQGAARPTMASTQTQQRLGPSKAAQKRQVTAYKDDPATFVWCGVCHKADHCLWDCYRVPRELQALTKRGQSAQQAADTIVQQTLSKYKEKGDDFFGAIQARNGRTKADLLRKLAA
jgi:hypothetical protein